VTFASVDSATACVTAGRFVLSASGTKSAAGGAAVTGEICATGVTLEAGSAQISSRGVRIRLRLRLRNGTGMLLDDAAHRESRPSSHAEPDTTLVGRCVQLTLQLPELPPHSSASSSSSAAAASSAGLASFPRSPAPSILPRVLPAGCSIGAPPSASVLAALAMATTAEANASLQPTVVACRLAEPSMQSAGTSVWWLDDD
jgi:hypothetical protein